MFVNWNYIILVVLTVEFHITKTSKKLDSLVFRIWNLKKLDSPSKNWTVGRYAFFFFFQFLGKKKGKFGREVTKN